MTKLELSGFSISIFARHERQLHPLTPLKILTLPSILNSLMHFRQSCEPKCLLKKPSSAPVSRDEGQLPITRTQKGTKGTALKPAGAPSLVVLQELSSWIQLPSSQAWTPSSDRLSYLSKVKKCSMLYLRIFSQSQLACIQQFSE